MKTNSVEEKIRMAAEAPINGKFNLVQFKKQKEKALKHKAVCTEIVNYLDSEEHLKYPIYALLMTGVSSNAFKSSEFEKGYKSFNKAKADACFKMTRAYLDKMNLGEKQPSDTVWQLCSRFYDKVSSNYDTFINALASAQVVEGADKRGNYKELCKNLGM